MSRISAHMGICADEAYSQHLEIANMLMRFLAILLFSSAMINVHAAGNLPPTVAMTATVTGATAPGTISLSATASDDGTISKVEFFNGASLLATTTQTPYAFTWSNVPAGTYSLTARATDNKGAATTTQLAVVTIAAGAAQIYYLFADQVNTTREITNAAGVVVWRGDASEPFGVNAPNENPSGYGIFSYNPRFPGQYYDKETNLHYNYHRDYDPQTGRYIESDPIGIGGGINTYGYVGGNPVSRSDSQGLLWDELGTFTVTAAATVTKFNPITAAAGIGFGAGILTYQACHPDEGEKCKEIQADILEAMGVIEGRLADMYIDHLKLYTLAYSSPNPALPPNSGSWTGHQRAVESWQNRLRNLIPKALSMGCKVPPHAYTLAYAAIPTRPGVRII
jgi:RHS repeat-associated protein